MQEEIKWYTIPKFPTYEINGQLEVRHKEFKKIKKCYMSDGYLKMNIDFLGKKYKPYLHQLVGWTFVANPKNKPELHHIDENKLNNRPDNLMWVTKQEHIQISKENGQMAFKLSKEDVVYIRDNYSLELEEELANKFGVKKITIYNVAIGRDREDVEGGVLHPAKGITKKIVDVNTGEIFGSAEELSVMTGIKLKEVRRQLSGERYCYIPYKYLYDEDRRVFPPYKPEKKVVRQPIGKFNAQNELIETYSDINQVSDRVLRQLITAFLNGRISNVKGFFYKRIGENGEFIAPPKFISQRKPYIPVENPKLFHKPMNKCSVDGEIIEIFESIAAAARSMGVDKRNFKKLLKKGRPGYYKGFIWKYAE